MSRAPLHALQGFVAAARTANLSRAAESMHLTVSALSHQIRGLESRMGQRLFVRGARGVALTDEGRALFDRIAPHLDAIEQAVRPGSTPRHDMLALTMLPSFASSWLVPRLPNFLARHPQMQVSLQSSSTVVDFTRDLQLDAGLRFGRGQWPGLQAVHLFDDWLTPTASPALIARLGRPTLQTLGTYPLLGDSGNRWGGWFATVGGDPPSRYVANFDDSETLHRAAVEGLGIALGRGTLMQPFVDAGLLVPLFDERQVSDFAHYLVYPARSADHTGLTLFREWLLEQAREYVESVASEQRRLRDRT